MENICYWLDENKIEYYKDYALSSISSFKIGGNADLAVFPSTPNTLSCVIKKCKARNISYKIIGNASNVLFSDNGFRGAIIFTSRMNSISLDPDKCMIDCMCGTKLISASNKALSASLSGLEFAHGIPGSVGGAVYMNAGAYGSDISDVLVESCAYDIENDTFITIPAKEHIFAYRQSIYSKNKNYICLSARFELSHGSQEQIKTLINENTQKRRNSQPIQFPSAGSYFKRPDGYFAAKLIDECGLKGVSCGGACISTQHAGFIINTGGATSRDVLELAEIVKNTVYKRFSVLLENEVQYIE